MPIAWQTAFADVPSSRVDTALAFWAAVTESVPEPATGTHEELLPLQPSDGDSYLWVQPEV